MYESINLKNFSGNLPLFPLSNIVHFPSTVLPLQIVEEPYLSLLQDALNGERLIGGVSLKSDAVNDSEDASDIYPVACLGTILKHETRSDGGSNILLLGIKRVEIKEIVKPLPYRTAKVELLEDTADGLSPQEKKRLKKKLLECYGEMAIEFAGTDRNFPTLSDGALKLNSLTDALAVSIGLTTEEMIGMLGERRIGTRADYLIERMEAMLKQGGPAILESTTQDDSDFLQFRFN